MKTNRSLLQILFILLLFTGCKVKGEDKLRLMSFNIRLNTSNDGKFAWPNRKVYVADLIHSVKPDVLGTQEVLPEQLNDLNTLLPDYQSFGVGRIDGKNKGEHCSVFYNASRLDLMDSGDFALSEHPDQFGEKGWDAACERMASWGKFRVKKSGNIFYVINTHLDHIGKIARIESVKQIKTFASKFNSIYPVVWMGDFNSEPNSAPVKEITADKSWKNTKTIAKNFTGPDWTFQDFGRMKLEERTWIDYIFINKSIAVEQFTAYDKQPDDNFYSDHIPVWADISITKSDYVMKFNPLTLDEESVILHKGTEYPFTGKYVNNKESGIYVCKQCNAPLYSSEDKFESHCGWPSFDDEIPGQVSRVPDADGKRTEIVCAKCGGHLGHVFEGEGFTEKNTRHCVNSISMNFIPANQIDTAYFASGCFWGTQYHFNKAAGVIYSLSGYMGGNTFSPTYKEVCSGMTGHIETVEVVFDKSKTSFETLLKLYYETHNFEQVGGQGPDIGEQYQSVVFYNNDEQKQMVEKYIQILTDKGYKVATQLRPAPEFWAAEEHHQDYYEKKNGTPYCHAYRKIF